MAPRIFLAGRVAVEVDGRLIDEDRFAGRQGRLVFACLVMAHGRPVPNEELADAIWGESPPASWRKALSVIVSKVRALLAGCGIEGANVLTSAFGCYRLDLPPGSWVDVLVAIESVHEAEKALADDELEASNDAARQAALLTRQPFLPGDEGAWVDSKRRELSDVRCRALACLADASFRAGRLSEAATWAEEAIALEPFRETGYRRLMDAHAAAGNRAEALRVYERCRVLLADELGAYPSPETESSYRRLLGGSPDAVLEPEPARLTGDVDREATGVNGGGRVAAGLGRRGLRVAAVFSAVGVAAAFIALIAIGFTDEERPRLARVQDNAIGVVDLQSRAIVDEAPEIASPQRVAAGEGAIWVTSSASDGSVMRLDPESHDVVDTIEVGNGPVGIDVGARYVWVANSLDGTVSRIDPAINKEVEAIPVGNTPTGVAFGEGAVWVTNTDDRTISRIDPRTSTPGPPIDVGVAARWIAVGGGAVWVTDTAGNTLVRIDPLTGAVIKSISVGSGPTAVAFGNGSVWVTNSLDGTVSRIDARQEIETGRFQVGAAPNGIVVAPDGVWVSLEVDGKLVHLDPTSGEPAPTTVGGRPAGLALADGSLWIAVQAAGDAHRGGTLRMIHDIDSIDPAIGYTPAAGQLLPTVYDGLVGFKKVGGADGNTIVPDLASAVPAPTDDGKTYTFRLREGIKFSDGSALEASAVRASLERIFKAHSPVLGLYQGILGGSACMKKPERCNLSQGVITDDKTGIVTIKLSTPDADFLTKLALTQASIVPTGTPATAETPIPGTGPYRIAEYTPQRRVRLVRNPHFKLWSKEARPEGIPDEIVSDYLVDYSLWISVQAPGATKRGGTQQMNGYIDNIDPALSDAPAAGPFRSVVYDALVGHEKVDGAERHTLVPDLATALPIPTDNGRTYTFRLRKGIEFSDGTALEASAVLSSLERLFRAHTLPPRTTPPTPIEHSPFLTSFEGIVGGPACIKRPKRCDLSKGVLTDDQSGTVTIRLLAPDPDFLDKLTSAFIVPTDTPATGKKPIPGTGPYEIAEYRPNRRVRLVRNPLFKVWSKPAQPEGNPDEIVLALSKTPGDAVLTEVQRGRADLAQQGNVPPSRLKEARTRYAAQLRVTPRAGVYMYLLNTHRPPFDNELARKAVAFAIDRWRLVEGSGGSELATPTCQLLSPNFPGYDRYCRYTVGPTEDGAWTAPDLETAHRLVAESGTKGKRVEILGASGKFEDSDDAAATIVLRETLEALGYRVSVSYDLDPLKVFFVPKPRGEAWTFGWFPDYWTPAGYLGPLLLCANNPYGCDPAIDRLARQLKGRDSEAATAGWVGIERELVDRAIVVPYVTPTAIDFVSKRVGNYQRHPFYGPLLSQLWVDEA